MVKSSNGFTLIEVLAAVTIIGILMGVGIPAVSKHLQKSKQEAYDVMINSIYDGTMSYMMDNNKYPTGISENTISIVDLENAGYVESLSDPGSSSKCGGTVKVKEVTGSGALPKYEYKIELQCPSKTINKTITS